MKQKAVPVLFMVASDSLKTVRDLTFHTLTGCGTVRVVLFDGRRFVDAEAARKLLSEVWLEAAFVRIPQPPTSC